MVNDSCCFVPGPEMTPPFSTGLVLQSGCVTVGWHHVIDSICFKMRKFNISFSFNRLKRLAYIRCG